MFDKQGPEARALLDQREGTKELLQKKSTSATKVQS